MWMRKIPISFMSAWLTKIFFQLKNKMFQTMSENLIYFVYAAAICQ